MNNKIKVGIICGGKSAEHEVSLLSARNIYEALDRQKYDVTILFINQDGKWYLPTSHTFLENKKEGKKILTPLIPSEIIGDSNHHVFDIVLPILHGTQGEDGTIQGMLTLLDTAYIGSGVLGSAIGMDKDVTKRLLKEQNMPTAEYEVVHSYDTYSADSIIDRFGLPLFIKPANLGSSIGISKVKKKEELQKAIEVAFSYDTKIIIERFIKGREIACGILGSEDTITISVLGEIKPHHEFYTYEAKYIDPQGATYTIPANLPIDVSEKIQEAAKKTFLLLEGSGMARIDFFVTDKNEFYINEINTIPGFTKNSMYPRLFAASGVSYSELLDKLIADGLSRYKKKHAKLTRYTPKASES